MSEPKSVQEVAGTIQRLARLRDTCLVRDRHRCVISHKFDVSEAMNRIKRDGLDKAEDDDGYLLGDEADGTFAPLEVAHILPHSLLSVGNENMKLVCTHYIRSHFIPIFPYP